MLSEDWGKGKGFKPFSPSPLPFTPPSSLRVLLVSIEDLNIKPRDGLFPYVQPSVKKALEIFLKDYGKPLTINNAYHSVVAQTVLYKLIGI